MWWTTGGALGALLVSDVVAFRWLLRLSSRQQELADRLAYLEGKTNGRPPPPPSR